MNAEPVPNTVVAYYRVSTKGQETSGLGLDAQKDYVDRWVNRNSATVVKEFKETESGGNSSRPKLMEAIQFCKDHDHTLLVAKLDRLSRSVSLIAGLMNTSLRFVCCDMPEANELTIHIIAAMAENERKLISQRTKEALAAKRRREPTWKAGSAGAKNLTDAGRKKAGGVIHQRYRKSPSFQRALATIRILAAEGKTQADCVAFLNDNGFLTSTGKPFALRSVRTIGKYGEVKWKGPQGAPKRS